MTIYDTGEQRDPIDPGRLGTHAELPTVGRLAAELARLTALVEQHEQRMVQLEADANRRAGIPPMPGS